MSPAQSVPPAGSPRWGFLLGPWAAAILLAGFWVFLLAGLREKSLTFDEVAYAVAGYSGWHLGDYRLAPEGGQLPQRIIGLPLVLGADKSPPPDSAAWRNAEVFKLGFDWFYQPGNDAARLAAWSRGACGALAVALGALVWAWSRRLFGPAGGMLSLGLYVLNPTILANGALMTSDMAAALFFFAAIWSLWSLGEKLTVPRVLGGGLVIGALVNSKMSAVLILPMALLLAALRVADGRPLRVEIGRAREIRSRGSQALALFLAATVQVAVVVATVWADYGFRFSAFHESTERSGRFILPWAYVLGQKPPGEMLRQLDLNQAQQDAVVRTFEAHGVAAPFWSNNALDAMNEIGRDVLSPAQRRRLEVMRMEPPPAGLSRVPYYLRQSRVLPEAWIYALADVLRKSQWRSAFFNGEFSMVGWTGYFPYTFWVKTPLEVFGVMALAVAAVFARRRGAGWRGFWARAFSTVPLWIFLAVYWSVTLTSHLNIGHRHLLPVYAPIFVLCGAAGWWWDEWIRQRRMPALAKPAAPARSAMTVLAGLVVLLAWETGAFYPNFLAYFNGVVSPNRAYRHLVDSSLDWGQELPAIKRRIADRPAEGPYYLSYFGLADPAYYAIPARPLASFFGLHLQRQPPLAILPLLAENSEAALAEMQRARPEYDLLTVTRGAQGPMSVWLKWPAELRLGGGTYLISASMLQPVYYELTGPWGPWNLRHEAAYQRLYSLVKPLLGDDAAARVARLKEFPPNEWPALLQRFEIYRFARLTAWLRRREPDDTINYSVLVYRLTDADVAAALDGPPVELGPDRAKEMLELQRRP